jgi:hypothetical protein
MSKPFLSLLRALLFGLACLALTSCTSATPQVTYYSLAGTDAAKPAAQRHEQLVVSVGPVALPDVLKKTQIATDGADGRYKLSDYHRWAGGVDRDFARAVAEQLANRLGTEKITLYPADHYAQPTDQILFDILAMDGVLGREANLAVRWSLVDPKSKNARMTRRSTFSEQPADGSYDAWIIAQRHNINRLSEEIASAIKAAH